MSSLVNLENAVVITGLIASGKSSVCKLLRQSGHAIIDADDIAHRVLQELYIEIEQEFGREFVQDGRVNRGKLGELVFQDTQAMQRLKHLTHPNINQQLIAEARTLEMKNKLYFMDIPLFFEVQRNYTVAAVVLVYCKKEIAAERLMHRNDLTMSEAQQRIQTQLAIDEKKKWADFVVDNSADKQNLQQEIQALLGWLNQ